MITSPTAAVSSAASSPATPTNGMVTSAIGPSSGGSPGLLLIMITALAPACSPS